MLTACPQVARHLVEGIDQHANFIAGGKVKVELEIAVCNASCPLGEFHNRDGDVFGEIKPEPNGTKYNQQSNDRQRDIIGNLDRLFEQFDLLVFLKALGNGIHIVCQGGRHDDR